MTQRKLREANKVVKRIRFIVRTVMTTLIIFGLLFAIISMIIVGIMVKSWFDGHRIEFRSPIVFVNPVTVSEIKRNPLSEIIKKREAIKVKEAGGSAKIETKIETEKDIVMSQKDGKLLWAMYQLETQRGLTDYCRLNNKGFGGWGVKDRGSIVCYETFSKAVERAQHWLTKNKENKTLAQALCHWSGHSKKDPETNKIIFVNDCAYFRNAVSML